MRESKKSVLAVRVDDDDDDDIIIYFNTLYFCSFSSLLSTLLCACLYFWKNYD